MSGDAENCCDDCRRAFGEDEDFVMTRADGNSTILLLCFACAAARGIVIPAGRVCLRGVGAA